MNKEIEVYTATSEITVVEAMKQIDKGARGILFIVDGEERLIGCVTDGDIRRWLITTADLSADVSKFMSQKPIYVFASDDVDAKTYMRRFSIAALPVLNTDRKIIDIVFLNVEKRLKEKQDTHTLANVPVVVMAGGKGTRLYPYTKILPKPLIPIGDVPIVERIMDRFAEYGSRDFYLTVNYKKGMIKSYFEERQPKYSVVYVEENKPLGTGGSLQLIENVFVCPFFVTNCDILIDANYVHIYKHHIESRNAITIVSALKTQIIPYGVLQIAEQGVVCGMEEKPSISHFINTGMYIINPELVDMIPKDTFYNMTQLIEDTMKQGLKVGIYPISADAFLDMGEFEELRRMEEKIKS